jgi:hypothetical protein
LGIKSFFSKEGRHNRQVAKWARIVQNPKAAGEDRWAAMLELAKDGSAEALEGLLMRYTYTAEVGTRSRVTDEQEKNLVYELVTEMGEAALPQVKQFLLSELGPPGRTKHSISFALRILEAISPDADTTWAILQEIIEANEPGYERDPNRKIELLTFLGEWDKDPRVAEAILGYLDDADEGVRFQTAAALLSQGHEHCREPLLQILQEGDESYQMRNRILSGFVANGWLDDVKPFLETLDEPGLMQVAESLVAQPDASAAREPLVKIAESRHASERIKSRVAEWFVSSGASTHGMRGRLEKILPKGYKISKKRVDRFPEAMREPYLSLAVEQLMDLDDPALVFEPLVRLLRNKELPERLFVRTVEYLAMRQWPVEGLAKPLRKVLPPGYVIGESGHVERDVPQMQEPFLTAAGDNLLEWGDADEPEVLNQLLEVVINHDTDERVRERILDSFSREEWSVLGYERDVERKLPREYKLQVVNHGQDFRIVRVLARI